MAKRMTLEEKFGNKKKPVEKVAKKKPVEKSESKDFETYDDAFVSFEKRINAGEQDLFLQEWTNHAGKFTLSKEAINDKDCRVLHAVANGEKIGYNHKLHRWN